MSWWGTKTVAGKYTFKMVMSFSSDPSSIVHDIHGDFELEEGETMDQAPDKIIAEYVGMHRHLRGDSVQILSFSHS
jgi:hypothetical protein